MTDKKLEEVLLDSFQISCKGANKEGMPVFSPEEKAEQVIVKVYKEGGTEPLCRYKFKGITSRCNPNFDDVQTEDELGVCPYASKQ